MPRPILALFAAALALPALARADNNPDLYKDGAAPPLTLNIGRMPAPPALDGDLADWPASATSFLLGQNSQTGRRFAWGGTRDSSGAVRLAWDETYLYLGADVVDDHQDPATNPSQIWQGDTLELFFNAQPRVQQVERFWQQAIIPPLAPGTTLKATGPQKDFTGIEGTAVPHPGGYTLECRIPWENLTGFTTKSGQELGFQLYLDDRDGNGRKSQLFWYPSAISFSRPQHTNIIKLAADGEQSQPKVLAGPNNWCVTDPNTMAVSAVTNVPGAVKARLSLEGNFKKNPAVDFELKPASDSVSVGQTNFDVTGIEGLRRFDISVLDANGQVLAANTFQAELVGERFNRMRALNDGLKTKLAREKDQINLADIDLETQLAGLNAWYTRLSAFVFNEARPEALNATLLDEMLTEYTALDAALERYKDGRDPYEKQTGSFVRAYQSPLTGAYRPMALYVPENYDPKRRYPLIVILHSIFADERMISLLAPNFKNLDAIVLQAPSYRQFDWGGVNAAETFAGLNEVQKLYSIDMDRVSLAGYHIGGRGVWQLAELQPDRWSAIAPIFSGIDTGPNYPALKLYPQYYQQATNVQIPAPQFKKPAPPIPIQDSREAALYQQSSLVTRLDNIAHIPIRSAYGEDEPNAAAERLAMEARLKELGANFQTHYVPGAMHGSPAEEFSDPAFYQWLISQRRTRPNKADFTVTTLRDNYAWGVRVDALSNPSRPGHVRFSKTADGSYSLTTSGIAALSLDMFRPSISQIDGHHVTQTAPPPVFEHHSGMMSFIRSPDGNWSRQYDLQGKRTGFSGPIDDFQSVSFIFVYGTGGDAATNDALQKQAKKMADWGLGAVFPVKADKEVTPEEIQQDCLILIGNPANNSLIAGLGANLPLEFLPDGFRLGDQTVTGPGAGACLIFPNPRANLGYVVLVTANDPAGYAVWDARKVGGDFVLGTGVTADGKTTFAPAFRGWFDNQWKYSKDLMFRVTQP